MENDDLSLLLKFAQAIQQKIITETDENAKKSLEKDLILVKDEIGKRVLNLPHNTPIFPPFESSQFLDAMILSKEECQPNQIFVSPINSPARPKKIPKIQTISESNEESIMDSNSYNDNQSIDDNSICSFPEQSNFVEFNSTEEIAAKFKQFMKQKESKKTKESRIPKPRQKSRIPGPKQK